MMQAICIVLLKIPFSCLFMIIVLGTVSFLWLCLFLHLFLRFPLYFTCPPPQTLLSSYHYQIFCLEVVAIHELSIYHQDVWKNIHSNFLFNWISDIFLPIFSIFQCIPPVFTLIYTVKLILHTFTYHSEHVIILNKHLTMIYFVWAAIIILIWLYPTWLRFWGSGSLAESKWYHYVMVEADSHLKLHPTSTLDIYKVLEHIDMLSIGIW